MLWDRLLHSARRRANRKPAVRARFRPNLDSLEDRTLLSLTTFYIDDTQSSLTLSGNVSGAPLNEQGPGSLVTAYTGDIQADVDFDNGAITFNNNGDGAIAEISGNWQPRSDGSAGAEPANYGGQVSFLGTALAAIRGAVLGGYSDPLPLSPLGDGVTYQFPSGQHLQINSGSAAYSHPLLGHGTADLSGYGADNQADQDGNPSYLFDFNSDGGSFLGLYASVDVTVTASLSGIQATLNIDGVIVAYGSIGTSPGAQHHGTQASHDAALGTALVSGAHATNQDLMAGPLGNLDKSDSLGKEKGNLLNAQAQTQNGQVGTTDSQVVHHTSADQLDAAFVQLSPIENMMI